MQQPQLKRLQSHCLPGKSEETPAESSREYVNLNKAEDTADTEDASEEAKEAAEEEEASAEEAADPEE